MTGRSRHAASLEEALGLCARHGRGALGEAAAALKAAIDALSFFAFGCAADESALEPFWLLAHELGRASEQRGLEGEALLRVFGEALDEEIARWELRGKREPEARAVFCAFAELRDLLREFGLPAAGPRRAPQQGQRDEAGSADGSPRQHSR